MAHSCLEVSAASLAIVAPVSRINAQPKADYYGGRSRPKVVPTIGGATPRAWPGIDELLTPSDVMAILKVGAAGMFSGVQGVGELETWLIQAPAG